MAPASALILLLEDVFISFTSMSPNSFNLSIYRQTSVALWLNCCWTWPASSKSSSKAAQTALCPTTRRRPSLNRLNTSMRLFVAMLSSQKHLPFVFSQTVMVVLIFRSAISPKASSSHWASA